MQRVIAYIDGFNLYFGLKALGWKRYYWLNVQHMAARLLNTNQMLVMTKYFTSRISGNPAKQKRQTTFIEALETLPDLRIYYGHFLSNPRECPRHAGKMCTIPDEKMTDVNIAVELLIDAFRDGFDTALLVSADSDLTAPVQAVTTMFPDKRVIVMFPPGRSSKRLAQVATLHFQLGRAVLARSQFPENVVKKDGSILTRPTEWR